MDRLLPMLVSLVVSLPPALSYFSYAAYSSITDAVVGVAEQASHFLNWKKLHLPITDSRSTSLSDLPMDKDQLMYDDIQPVKRNYGIVRKCPKVQTGSL